MKPGLGELTAREEPEMVGLGQPWQRAEPLLRKDGHSQTQGSGRPGWHPDLAPGSPEAICMLR